MSTITDTGADVTWLRIERRPGCHLTHMANDTIQLSRDNISLFDLNRDKLIAKFAIHGAGFRHVLHVLCLAHDAARPYHWSSLNCWFFAEIVIGTLHAEFQGRWLRPPKPTG